MKFKAIVAAAVLSVSVSGAAQAGPNPYSDCGIGAALFKNDIAAAISNVIWDLGVTAIISATTSPETCTSGQAETAMMILETLPDMERDLALRSGDNAGAVMASLQCSGAALDTVAASYDKTLMSEDYATLSDIDKATAIYTAVESVSKTDQCAISL